MRVFVTGATGFVGSATVQELIGAGHDVLGLVRTDEGAAALRKAGAEPHCGSLDDLDALRTGAAAADGVIHTAFNHDFSRFQENCAADVRAIEALGSALEGSRRPLLVTSGLARLTPGRVATEADLPPAPSASYPRASEAAAVTLSARGVAAGVVRLPPSVHGEGDHGFVPHLIATARARGVSAYVGDGSNRWAAVHRLDAAKLYRLALERGAADGPWHAIAEEGIAFFEIAAIIGERLGVPVKSIDEDEAAAHFGWFAHFAAMDAAASSARTRKLLGWEATGPGLITDIGQPGYYAD